MNSPSYFEIQADDIQRVLEFYKEIFGWKFAIPSVCWQGYFLDTEGNVFGLFQPDKDAK